MRSAISIILGLLLNWTEVSSVSRLFLSRHWKSLRLGLCISVLIPLTLGLFEWLLLFHRWSRWWVKHWILGLSTNNYRFRVEMMMNPFMLNSFWHFMLLIHRCVLKQSSFLIPVVFTMLPSTVLFIFMFVMMSGNHFDWYIDVLCGVSHGLVINVSSGMLDRLVVDVSLSMGDWLILSF